MAFTNSFFDRGPTTGPSKVKELDNISGSPPSPPCDAKNRFAIKIISCEESADAGRLLNSSGSSINIGSDRTASSSSADVVMVLVESVVDASTRTRAECEGYFDSITKASPKGASKATKNGSKHDFILDIIQLFDHHLSTSDDVAHHPSE
mmetsp:Transcript_54113/g.107433  ORF Transcript_54113/g.107433 Transcript_54113/m.107433 type:complete len:150 (-) Transcript_54113:16-465(-)